MKRQTAKKHAKVLVSGVVALAMAVTSIPISENVRSSFDMGISYAKTKSQPVLELKYDEPATDWESQALPIGNGKLGAMIFGGVESEKIQVNEETVWSGGPGANEDYDGGDNEHTTEEVHTVLQDARNSLQKMVSDFSKNSAAYIDSTTGEIISENYTNLTADSEFSKLLEVLKGEKRNFGTYQTLGNIVLSDPSYAGAKVIDIVTNADTGDNLSERTQSLFDNDENTKWFTGFSLNQDASIQWQYNRSVSISKYTMVSGNDSYARDPKAWILYGSNDGENFTKLDEQTDHSFDERKEYKEFAIETPGTYSYYKIVMTENQDGNNGMFQLSDIFIDGAEGTEASYSNYLRKSDIDNAIESVHYVLDGVTYDREYFLNNPSNVMGIKLTADKAGAITRDISLNSEHTKTEIVVDEAKGTITMMGQPADQDEEGLKFAKQIKVVAQGGTVKQADSSTLSVQGADSVVIYMSAATNYQVDDGTTYKYFKSEEPLADVEKVISAAVEKGYDRLREEHIKDYKKLFDRVTLNLGTSEVPGKMTDDLLADYGKNNTDAENRYLETLFYQYGRYLLIASSREDSQLPANLQGIWAQGLSPMWNSDYHTNINLQMNYWLAEQTNLTECHTVNIDYINSLVEKGKVTAKKYYCQQDGSDVRGWVIHHENNIWGNTNPSTYTTAFYFPAAAAWMCQDIWERYAYTKDEVFLEENYDTLLQAALFWVDNLWEDERDGTLVTNPSYSPEHGAFSLGCTSDQAIIWELFEEVKQASEILGKEESDEVKEIIAAQEKLYMPEADRLGGQLAEWKDETTLEITNSDYHRHQNQLFVLHPGTYVVAGRSEWDDQMIEAAKVTLEKRGDGGTGWSKAWKVNMWARMRDGDRAQKLLGEQLTGSTLTNLFDTHAPFQIDGNFGATSGMTEMLLQSQGEYIEPLAALPSAWANGSVTGIKARGNFELGMTWKNETLSEITVASGSGEKCNLKYDGIGSYKVYDETNKQYITATTTKDTISFATKAGVTYRVTTDANILAETPAPTATPEVPAVSAAPTKSEEVAVGRKITRGNVTYQVVADKTVEVKKISGSKKTVSIPNEIEIDGQKYKVTSVGKNVMKNKKKVTKVTIGKNVKEIGKQAFAKCKKLKLVVVKSKKLTKVGKKAFYKTNKKIRVKLYKSCKKKYKKMFRKSGISSSARYQGI